MKRSTIFVVLLLFIFLILFICSVSFSNSGSAHVQDDRIHDSIHPFWVTTELRGGLGNQLFQLAAAFRFADAHPSMYQVGFEQDREWISPESEDSRPTYWHTLLTRVPKLNILKTNQVQWLQLEETKFGEFNQASPPIQSEPCHVRLVGYFQGWNQVQHVLPQVRACMNPELFVAHPYQPDTVAIHIRLTDYQGSSLHTNLTSCPDTKLYYRNAIDRLSTLASIQKFLVFSDDPIQALLYFQSQPQLTSSLAKFEFRNNPNTTDVEDLMSMISCQHHIIANSTFSWWAAVLSHHEYSIKSKKKQIMIAPQKWFLDTSIDWSGIYPTYCLVL